MANLLAILAKGKGKPMMGKPSPEESEEPAGLDEAAEAPGQEYGDELADLLGVSDDDKDAFLTALSGYVRSCSGGEE